MANKAKQLQLPIAKELIVDLFAGGGGWSTAFEQATGQHPHISINHDDQAISMHKANHPQSKHYQADVFEVCPREAVGDMPVGWMHLSPDCTHHSQAKGGQPRDRKIRALSWVGIRWAGQVSPRIISLENVRQILNWGPLVAKRCPKTGGVIRTDGSIAAKGEYTPAADQFLVPCKKRQGETWKRFVTILRNLGYDVEWKRMVAADYGAPTTRDRLFLMARRDGVPIEWPAPTHYKMPSKGQKKWRSAAECIDWSIESKSIFERPRPLADATMRRIARGVKRFIVDSQKPFLVQTGYGERKGQAPRSLELTNPLGTVVAGGVKHALVSPVLIQASHGEGSGKTKRWGQGCKDITAPLNTITTTGGGGQSVALAYLAQMNGGFNQTAGRCAHDPITTITNTGSQQQLVTANLVHVSNTPESPSQLSATEASWTQDDKTKALRTAAFLINYYGNGDARDLTAPLDTVTTRDRLALVTVTLGGTPYLIVDIKLRMLQPNELYKAQGFPDNYVITHGHDGKPMTKTAQVRMCGNSVSPPPARALVEANWTAVKQQKQVA